MIRKDTVSPFTWQQQSKSRQRPNASRIRMTEVALEWSLCGQVGSRRERHCQLFKLTFLSILPGLILIIRNGINVAESFTIFDENREVKKSVQYSVELGAVIHALQLERGTTALYVSSSDTTIKRRLAEFKVKTINAIEELSKWEYIPEPEHFRSRDAFRTHLIHYRDLVDPKNTTKVEVINFYSELNDIFIHLIGMSLNVKKQLTFWTDITAYQMLIYSKEQAGTERAIGSTYYAKGQLTPDDLLWYNEKQVLGKTFLKQCVDYSSYAHSLLDDMYTDSSLAVELKAMRETIINNTESVPSIASGTMWFDNMTEYIDKLNFIQEKMAGRIVLAVNEENTSLEENLTVTLIEFIVAIVMVPIIVVLVRNIIQKIHRFSRDLNEKTRELEAERKRTEELLYQLLPRTVAKRLMEDGTTVPEAYHSATIMFSDVVGFTLISSASTPMQVINMLNNLYLTIDNRLENFDVYKVETIGDGYMVASGIPNRNGGKHVEEICKLAVDLLVAIEKMEIPHLRHQKIKLRLGLNTGPCVAGVVGVKMPRYCIFGDTVNTASRMESTGVPSKIQMTESSASKLDKNDGFEITERGLVEVKGKGMMRTFWLDGYVPRSKASTSEHDSQSTKSVHSANLTLINVKETTSAACDTSSTF